jgi:hypothetical protein
LLAQTEVDRNPAVLSKLPKRPCRHLDDKSRVVSGVPISPVGSIEAPWGRFGYSDLKEAGGVCGGCGQAIGIESTLACNMLKEVELANRRKSVQEASAAHDLRSIARVASAVPMASFKSPTRTSGSTSVIS